VRLPRNRELRKAVRAELAATGKPGSFFERMAAQCRVVEALQREHGGDLLSLTQAVAPHFAELAGR
jgi:hypothetical protein